jgi:hypothetical protein
MLKSGIHFLKLYLWEELLLLIIIVFLFVRHPNPVIVSIIFYSYVFLVLLIHDTYLSYWIKKDLWEIKKERSYGVLIIIFITLLLIWQFRFETIIFLTLFICFALYDWDERMIATGALVSLASSLIHLMAKQYAHAEQMAVYAYYFLVITVILKIIEYKRFPERIKADDQE